VNGKVKTVKANSAADVEDESDISPSSGIMLVPDGSVTMSGNALAPTGTYQYVDVNGNVAEVGADNADQALSVSNIAPASGVMLDTSANTLSADMQIAL